MTTSTAAKAGVHQLPRIGALALLLLFPPAFVWVGMGSQIAFLVLASETVGAMTGLVGLLIWQGKL